MNALSQLGKNRNLVFAAIILLFLTLLSGTMVMVYNDALFLSSYPPSYLFYFYYASTPAIIITVLLIEPIVSRGTNKRNIVITLLLAGSLLIGYVIQHYNYYWLPFIFCTYLNIFRVVLLVITSNTVATAFNIVDFKRFSTWFTSAYSMGQIVGGYLSAVLTDAFGLTNLITVSIAILLINIIFLKYIDPKFQSIEKAKGNYSPLRYPLLRNIFTLSILMGIVYTLAAFALKYQLATSFSKDAIAIFMGTLTSSIAILSFLIQLFGVKKILQRFGLATLMTLPPAFAIAGSLLFAIKPNVVTGAIFLGGINLFESSLNKVAFEIALNPLPRAVRSSGKLYEKGISSQLGKISAITLLIATTYYFGLRIAGVFAFVACIIWYWRAKAIDKNYQAALLSSINSKRFVYDVENGPLFSEELANPVMVLALTQQKPEDIRLAFALFQNTDDIRITQLALDNLNAEEDDIRIQAINVLNQRHIPNIQTPLLHRLQVETNPDIVWLLIRALVPISSQELFTFAADKISSHTVQEQLYGAAIMLLMNDVENKDKAVAIVTHAVGNPEPRIREFCAKLFALMGIDEQQSELAILLEDDNPNVIIQAIQSVAERKAIYLIPEIMHKLSDRHVSFYAANALVAFGDIVIEPVAREIKEGRVASIDILIRVLCSIESKHAEEKILRLARSTNLLVKTYLAKHVLISMSKIKHSAEFYNATYELIFESATTMNTIKQALTLSWPKWIQHELTIRLQWAEMCCLYWYGVNTNPSIIFQVIPVMTQYKNIAAMERVHSSTVELLDSLAKNQSMRHIIATINTPVPRSLAASVDEKELYHQLDDWTKQFIVATTHRTDTMPDSMKKLVALRSVGLFAQLPGEILYTVGQEMGWREFTAGEIIYNQGDVPDGFYIIVSGKISIQRDDKILVELIVGDYFGEISVFDGLPRTANAIAITSGKLLTVDNVTFDNITANSPEVMRALARYVIAYVRKSH